MQFPALLQKSICLRAQAAPSSRCSVWILTRRGRTVYIPVCTKAWQNEGVVWSGSVGTHRILLQKVYSVYSLQFISAVVPTFNEMMLLYYGSSTIDVLELS